MGMGCELWVKVEDGDEAMNKARSFQDLDVYKRLYN